MAYSQLLADHWLALDPDKKEELMLEVAHACQGGTNFNSLLIRIAGKSDVQNLHKLFGVYSGLVSAMHAMGNGIIPYTTWQAIEEEAQQRQSDSRATAELMQHTLAKVHGVHSGEYQLLDCDDAAVNIVDNGAWCNVRLFLNEEDAKSSQGEQT